MLKETVIVSPTPRDNVSGDNSELRGSQESIDPKTSTLRKV